VDEEIAGLHKPGDRRLALVELPRIDRLAVTQVAVFHAPVVVDVVDPARGPDQVQACIDRAEVQVYGPAQVGVLAPEARPHAGVQLGRRARIAAGEVFALPRGR